ncbi:MAG: hypothetical protein IKP88_20670 [Lachnospiraceae bacterium]|nr:hypothetical protein [Lachnospiraceae bacterium]
MFFGIFPFPFLIIAIIAIVCVRKKNMNNRLPGDGNNRGYIDYDRNMTYNGSNFPDKNRYVQEPGFVQNGGMPYMSENGEDIVIDNSMGNLTRYLQSSHLRSLKISNGMGNCIIYYDNVMVDEFGSNLTINNGMGTVKVYIPPFYRFQMSQNNGLGSIKVHGNPSMNPQDPMIEAYVENGLGKVDFYFG